jgi:DNA-binding MarR family transcriptional regulator
MTSRSRENLAPADYQDLAEFRSLLRRFLAFSEVAARAAGLAPQQHQALLAIKGFAGEPTIGDLAKRLAIKHHSAVGLVDRLANAGYIKRRPDKADRRKVSLVLTTAGEKLLHALTFAHRQELRALTPSFRALFAKLER